MRQKYIKLFILIKNNYFNLVIKTIKLLLRLIVIKKTCPEQWAKISHLDNECKNKAVKEEVKGNRWYHLTNQ